METVNNSWTDVPFGTKAATVTFTMRGSIGTTYDESLMFLRKGGGAISIMSTTATSLSVKAVDQIWLDGAKNFYLGFTPGSATSLYNATVYNADGTIHNGGAWLQGNFFCIPSV